MSANRASGSDRDKDLLRTQARRGTTRGSSRIERGLESSLRHRHRRRRAGLLVTTVAIFAGATALLLQTNTTQTSLVSSVDSAGRSAPVPSQRVSSTSRPSATTIATESTARTTSTKPEEIEQPEDIDTISTFDFRGRRYVPDCTIVDPAIVERSEAETASWSGLDLSAAEILTVSPNIAVAMLGDPGLCSDEPSTDAEPQWTLAFVPQVLQSDVDSVLTAIGQ